MGVVGVRGFQPSDREAVREICYRTGYMGDSAERFWRHRESWADIWTSYYTDREPESLYVATMGNSVVGYLTGCVDTARAPGTDDVMMAAIRKHWLLVRPGTAGFLFRGMLDSMREQGQAGGELHDSRWPAHLHINLLLAARGTGLGKGLMEKWQRQLTETASPGCHLGTLVENTRAMSFFEKMGFQRHGEPALVPGMRGKGGERLHGQILVWNPRSR